MKEGESTKEHSERTEEAFSCSFRHSCDYGYDPNFVIIMWGNPKATSDLYS